MALTRDRILETALGILRAYGLADLSMRRVAQELDVAPGALYYHVRNKQELLSHLAARILRDPPTPGQLAELSVPELHQEVLAQAEHVRACLGEFPDAADVVALAVALRPESLEVLDRLRRLVSELSVRAGRRVPARQEEAEERDDWAAQALVHTVLGFVRAAQDRARIATAPVEGEYAREACEHAVGLFLTGLSAPSGPTH